MTCTCQRHSGDNDGCPLHVTGPQMTDTIQRYLKTGGDPQLVVDKATAACAAYGHFFTVAREDADD